MSRKRKIFWSFVVSAGMLVFSYWVTNLQIPISGEKEVISMFEAVRGSIYEHRDTVGSNVILIDVDYDKQLITKTDECYKTLGEAYPVTDRSKLTRLLEALRKKKDYAYVLLDVSFENGEETDADSALYATISSMKCIVIPCDSLKALPDTCLYKKAGLAYYQVTPIESDFVKYPYLSKQKTSIKDTTLASMPLRMYEDITKRHIKKFGPIYWDGWLARSSIVLNLNYKPIKWRNLGVDFLYNNEIEKLPTKNKYIIIGSSKNDLHPTYIDRISGAIINFNAYLALINHHHIVSPTLMLLLFVSFFIFSYLILSKKKLSESISMIGPYQNKWLRLTQRILVALCSWIGFSAYLMILCILTYVFLDEVYDIFITSTMFYVFNLIVKLSDYLNYGK